MNSIKVSHHHFGELDIIGERLNEGHDFLINSNCKREDLDILIFLDSRGISAQFEDSLAERLEKYFSDSPYLIMCRPLELTTWVSLYNFIKINNLSPKKIITNMGFVDFTPKKQVILDDVLKQIEALIGPAHARSYIVEDYLASSGEVIPLYCVEYSEAYRRKIMDIIGSTPTIIINTPLLKKDIKIKRQRPHSFYTSLSKTNEFNHSLGASYVVDVSLFDENQTYDGVHYTNEGNEIIFSRLKYIFNNQGI